MNENKLVIPFLSTLVVVLSATITFMVVQKTNSKVAVAVKKDAQTETTGDAVEIDTVNSDPDIPVYGPDEFDDEDDAFALNHDLQFLKGQTKPPIDYNATNTVQLIEHLKTLEEELTKSQTENIELNLHVELLKERHNEQIKLLRQTIKNLKTKNVGGKKRRSKTVRRRQK